MTPETSAPTFGALPLSARALDKLSRLGLTTPTPIQAAALPPALGGRDVVGLAQTGTGKTLAFGLPIHDRLADQMGQALVVLPTRELAAQVEETLKKLGLTTALVVGGAGMNPQVQKLRSRPRVIVGTPGRLIDHLQQGTLRLDGVSIAVLDEADRLLDMGFAPAIRRILSATPRERQTLLFSATMPKEVEGLVREWTQDAQRVEIGTIGRTADTVAQELVVLDHASRNEHLGDLLRESQGPVIVFVRTRHGARKLAKTVSLMGHATAELHSDRSLPQRRAAMDDFRRGKARILVATDIAARGLDVQNVELVLNYDLPDAPEDYIHRIGRTGRAGASGRSVTFATPEQAKDVAALERTIAMSIPRSSRSTAEMPAWPPRPQGRPSAGRRPANAPAPARGRRPLPR